jgi:hypothetical protein
MRLIKGNVERIVEDQVMTAKLVADGFKELAEAREVETENQAEPENPPEPEKNLEDMTVPELKALAKEKGIEGASSLSKEDLIAVLKEVM